MGLHRVKDKRELMKLKNGCRAVKDENLEGNIGMPFFVHSPYSNTYYESKVEEYTNWDVIEEFVSAGNLYIQQ
jgi:hypothetical protein